MAQTAATGKPNPTNPAPAGTPGTNAGVSEVSVQEVLRGERRIACVQADAIEFLRGLPDDSVDLLFTSPPYELARTYGIGDKMVGGEAWVKWMFDVVTAASPKVKGLIAINCEGQTRNYRYSCVPFLLAADLHRAGFNLRKPVVFHRVGIPGSGGPDWLRNDWEPIICITRPGQLPWSDNTACGHPPKWAPGGEMSHRIGGRVRTQWGGSEKSGGHRKADGSTTAFVRPSHVLVSNGDARVNAKKHTKREPGPDGEDIMREQTYHPPVMANPGNVIKCTVGGGQMGHDLASENEAPFPLDLAEFFVKSFCPPDGIACDPFSGSGTVAEACFTHGRRFVGADIRQSQVDLCKRRLATVTPELTFTEAAT